MLRMIVIVARCSISHIVTISIDWCQKAAEESAVSETTVVKTTPAVNKTAVVAEPVVVVEPATVKTTSNVHDEANGLELDWNFHLQALKVSFVCVVRRRFRFPSIGFVFFSWFFALYDLLLSLLLLHE